MRPNYEADKTIPAHVTVNGWGKGIAFYTLGWETEPDEDTEWSGIENRTGNIIVCMVGDDRYFSIDPSDITPLKEGEYCPECGQTGCYCYR